MASRAGRLKERGKRGKHGSPEGEGGGERHGTGRLKERGGGERHAPAKPRLVAVLGVSFVSLASSKYRRAHIVFLRPPSPSGYWIAYFPFLSTFPKYRRAHIVFLRPPLLQAVGLPTFPFSLLSPSADGFTLSFSVPPPLRAIGLPHSPKLLLNLNYIEQKKHYFEAIYLIFISYCCILILFSLLYYQY